MAYTSIELCAGGGGQALGLENAGFEHIELIEIDRNACNTLRFNRPNWNVIECDIRKYSPNISGTVDLLAGGVPCPPFSVAGPPQCAAVSNAKWPGVTVFRVCPHRRMGAQ